MSYKNLSSEELQAIRTVGELKKAGYVPKSVKEELRDNLREKLRRNENVFEGIHGYEHTVVPDVERALLSMHNINFLGLRGQAKTRIARLSVNLLDEWVPIIAGSELNDDPLRPISRFGLELLAEKGEDCPVSWWHRDERYTEKLATPDVSVADLIGDTDPIKAAALKLPYSDERVLHFGLIPRSHRGIFVINELPDLQARIQVALFNILQEGDIQIRGFKVRLPLDVQFIFTANPEDYTNRGSIVTPLKDRIGSQILTHYPKDMETARKITAQEAKIKTEQLQTVEINETVRDLIEQISFEARSSEFVDEKSGVSARLTVSAFENLYSAAERRMLRCGEAKTQVRISDFWGVIPAIAGKVELVYEGEQEGAGIVAENLIGKAIRSIFLNYFPNPEQEKKSKNDRFKPIIDWFGDGQFIDLLHDCSDKDYRRILNDVPGLADLVGLKMPKLSEAERYFMMEFALHGLAEYSVLSRKSLDEGLQFKDLLSGMFTMGGDGTEDDY